MDGLPLNHSIITMSHLIRCSKQAKNNPNIWKKLATWMSKTSPIAASTVILNPDQNSLVDRLIRC